VKKSKLIEGPKYNRQSMSLENFENIKRKERKKRKPIKRNLLKFK